MLMLLVFSKKKDYSIRKLQNHYVIMFFQEEIPNLLCIFIKNSVVLIDQIDIERAEGKPIFSAIVDSSISRMRPVVMASMTTVLGMLPLLQDPFFISMAVTIMFGLTFATGLTLVVVPVLYEIFFRVKFDESYVK